MCSENQEPKKCFTACFKEHSNDDKLSTVILTVFKKQVESQFQRHFKVLYFGVGLIKSYSLAKSCFVKFSEI